MTISREHIPSEIHAGKVLCTGEGHRHTDAHLFYIHNGYGEKAHPLDQWQINSLETIAKKHERETGGTHDIRILYIHP